MKKHYIVFSLEKRRFALPLDLVIRVIRAVEVTDLPEAPTVVAGLINYKGRVLPVIDIRPRFNMEKRDIRLEDQFIILRTSKHTFALITDNVAGNIEKSEDEVVAPSRVIEGMSFLLGVIKLDDGIMIIPDLEKILTVGEEKILSKAITKKSGKSVTKKGISKK